MFVAVKMAMNTLLFVTMVITKQLVKPMLKLLWTLKMLMIGKALLSTWTIKALLMVVLSLVVLLMMEDHFLVV